MFALKTPQDLAFIGLRWSFAAVLLAHSLILKLSIYGLSATAAYFESLGLPGPLAYIVFALEALAAIALIAGFAVRWFALALLPVMLGATWVHWGNGWLFTNAGGGWEFPLFLAAVCAVLFIFDAGHSSVSKAEAA